MPGRDFAFASAKREGLWQREPFHLFVCCAGGERVSTLLQIEETACLLKDRREHAVPLAPHTASAASLLWNFALQCFTMKSF